MYSTSAMLCACALWWLNVWSAGMLISGTKVQCDKVFGPFWDVTELLFSVWTIKSYKDNNPTCLWYGEWETSHACQAHWCLPTADVLVWRWSGVNLPLHGVLNTSPLLQFSLFFKRQRCAGGPKILFLAVFSGRGECLRTWWHHGRFTHAHYVFSQIAICETKRVDYQAVFVLLTDELTKASLSKCRCVPANLYGYVCCFSGWLWNCHLVCLLVCN